MDSAKPKVSLEVPPYLRVYKDGTIERLLGNDVVPASVDSQTGVLSKDVVVVPETGVWARLYRPSSSPNPRKLPLLLYFHGGAFCISSASDPLYHRSLNSLVAEANVVAVSVNYRLAPENPLPAAYEDSWAALQWVAGEVGREAWLREHADFDRVFLVGDSAGGNIAHHLALRVAESDRVGGLSIRGVVLIHPYFWGQEPIGSEVEDPARKAMVDRWWVFVCPSERGNDDPMINPFADGAPNLAGLGCGRVLVCVAERDILRDRGRLYYESLVKSGWGGTAEMVATPGEDHVFYKFDPNCKNALDLFKRLASFINERA
ncbi:probable carboxylesterase 2 [Malania oleifera]|uniref:probable carboxylesterase 2 n=1 Tax=Malania oleifera TaxID=397392 RepID=UPI0025AEC5E1|nr:probable carboxylesterase 2 [Malania oleifera]